MLLIYIQRFFKLIFLSFFSGLALASLFAIPIFVLILVLRAIDIRVNPSFLYNVFFIFVGVIFLFVLHRNLFSGYYDESESKRYLSSIAVNNQEFVENVIGLYCQVIKSTGLLKYKSMYRTYKEKAIKNVYSDIFQISSIQNTNLNYLSKIFDKHINAQEDSLNKHIDFFNRFNQDHGEYIYESVISKITDNIIISSYIVDPEEEDNIDLIHLVYSRKTIDTLLKIFTSFKFYETKNPAFKNKNKWYYPKTLSLEHVFRQLLGRYCDVDIDKLCTSYLEGYRYSEHENVYYNYDRFFKDNFFKKSHENNKNTRNSFSNYHDLAEEYSILGVDVKASFAEIREKYISLVKQYHPDKAEESQKKECEEKIKIINVAYEKIKEKFKK